MGDASNDAAAVVPLVPGLEVRCEMPDLDGAIELGLEHDGDVLKREVITPEEDPKPFKLGVGPFEVDIALGAKNETGEVTVSGGIMFREPITDMRTEIADLDRVLLRYSPTHGSVGDRTDPDPPIFDDPDFGKTRMSSKNVTRIFVDENRRMLADVGRVVKKELWDEYPDWVFNTVACVGAFDDEGRGSYSDPTSHWFNVFLGYYQIDAPKPDWNRPFGYRSADGIASVADFEEITRLGKSDWNYFSNWMYGVPAEAAKRHNEIELPMLKTSQSEAGTIGSSAWHRVSIGNVRFVSAYEADHEDAERLVRNALVSDLWRKAFGTPNPRADFPDSFIETRTDADMYIAYWEDDAAFHTVMFGGTAPTGSAPEFLDRQMAEAKRVIERGYPSLGFKAG